MTNITELFESRVMSGIINKIDDLNKHKTDILDRKRSINHRLIDERFTMTHIEYCRLCDEADNIHNEVVEIDKKIKTLEEVRDMCNSIAGDISSSIITNINNGRVL